MKRHTSTPDTLRRLHVFAELSDRELEPGVNALEVRPRKKGDIVVEYGAPAECIYGVLSGRVKVVLPGPDGNDVTVAVLEPGEIFGELGVLRHSTRAAQVVALEDVELVRLNGMAFLDMVDGCHRLSRTLNVILAERILGLGAHAEGMAGAPVSRRLAKVVVGLAHRFGEGSVSSLEVKMRLPQQDLADMTQATRQSVHECLQRWRRAGIMEHGRNGLRITDLGRLEEISTGAREDEDA